jgi:Zn-dependent protease with chaperone function
MCGPFLWGRFCPELAPRPVRPFTCGVTIEESSRHAPPAGGAVTATLAGMLAIVALTWLLSLVVVGPMAYGLGLWLAGDGRVPLVLGVLCWTASAGLVPLRPVESRFASLLFRVRRPRGLELDRLLPVWRRACGRAGVDPDGFTLRIEDSDAVNAFALGAHFVAVTRRALDLPDELLEAVLAHELGHHRDRHPLAATLGWWYLLPLTLLSQLLRQVRGATGALSRVFSGLRQRMWQLSGGRPLSLLGLLVILGALVLVATLLLLALCALWLPLWLVTSASRLLSAALSRSSEFAADRHAAALGYAAGLVRVLELFELLERQAPRRGGLASRLASHPTCRARIQAVRRLGG